MTKVKVGDDVRVVAEFESDATIMWLPEMDSRIGSRGVVVEKYDLYDNIYGVRFEDGVEWWFKDSDLEVIPKPNFNIKVIDMKWVVFGLFTVLYIIALSNISTVATAGLIGAIYGASSMLVLENM